MEMLVHLHPEVFEIVGAGVKDVEIRVNDEKRRKLSVGDTLVFLKRPDEVQKIYARVTKLVYFKDFLEVVQSYPMERIYLKDTTSEEYVTLMKKFYSDEEVSKYGVVAIEFQRIDE